MHTLAAADLPKAAASRPEFAKKKNEHLVVEYIGLERCLMIQYEKLNWKQELRNNIKSVEELKEYIEMTPEEEQVLREVVEMHPMNIPRYYLDLMDPNDPNDPIKKLAIPQR